MTTAAAVVAQHFRAEHGRAVAVLARSFDLEIAEDAVQDAFLRALEHWPRDGVPPAPAGWIITTARRAAIDRIRREAAREDVQARAAREVAPGSDADDDRLRLVFTCCHPALALQDRVALTLRLVCGLQTPEIARLLLLPEPTLAQRLVRARRRIRLAGIPYRVPDPDALPERITGVLAVVALLFTEGYAATGAHRLIRTELCDEAIRLARLLVLLMPKESETHGLLALLLLADSRRGARTDGGGGVVLLADQDRARWNRDLIAEGLVELGRAAFGPAPGAYTIEASIQAEHAVAPDVAGTDWPRIVHLYDMLLERRPSPATELQRAIAVAEVEGPATALVLTDALPPVPRLDAVRAHLLHRLGRDGEAALAYRSALHVVGNEPERRFLEERVAAFDT